jgi:hypothetical protein
MQERRLAADRRGAIAAVPDELVDELALVGPKEPRAGQRLDSLGHRREGRDALMFEETTGVTVCEQGSELPL